MNRKAQSSSGLNKSDLYAPHINALKTMNKEQTNQFEPYQDDQSTDPDQDFFPNGTHYDEDDLYDFNNVKPTLRLDTGSNNSTDDEEEDDINFDYAYGYDYERVIKERLKIANQEFVKEPSVEKDRPITVSFDNAVTAFDIPKEQEESEAEKKEDVEAINKLPLNDTVEKKDPDSFANKIKEAIQRYDEEMAKMSQRQTEDQDEDVDDYFVRMSNENQSSSLVKNSTPSPPSRNSPEMTKNTNLKFISKIVDIVSTQDQEPNSPSPIPRSSPKITSPELKQQEDEGKKSSKEQVLVEIDGVFQLVDADEYTAKERERKSELEKKNKENKKPIAPHPPQRPKTSNNEFRKNKILKDKIEVKRVSRSADVNKARPTRVKSHSPIVKHSTPEYAKDYKSPYQATCKTAKPIETAEEKKKRQEEEEKRKQINKDAFEAWLKSKEKQRQLEQKRKSENSKKTGDNGTDEAKKTFDLWLKKKQEQIQREKDYQKKLEQIIVLDKRKSSPEERSKAFKEWLTRKIREKNEVVRQEKLEHKKWVSKRRKSRKHQRLSQALEMANAYGYSSSYFTPGFTY